jgi:phosphopantothenoylcysteine decarboxylase/phosphopantothenate--cysteine ligase
MRKAVFDHLEGSSIVIKAAAVSDYRPKVISQKKIKKGNFDTNLALERTEDILKELGEKKGNRILVGFAAETEDLVTNAKKKLREKNLDFIVVNDVTQPGVGFSSDTNQIKIIYPSGKTRDLPLMSKGEVSQVILNEVVGLLERKKKQKR